MIKYVRYKMENLISYGVLDQERVKEISSNPFEKYDFTG